MIQVLNSAAKVMSELQEELVFDIREEGERSAQNVYGVQCDSFDACAKNELT